MGSLSLTFHGASMEEIARLVADWTPAGAPRSGGAGLRAGAADQSSEVRDVRRVLSGVHGPKSLRLLRLLAGPGLSDEGVALTQAVVEEFGLTSASAFGGMIGPVNRRALNIMGRRLINWSPDENPETRPYWVAAEDARVILDVLDRT
jgi:hypothetical protein